MCNDFILVPFVPYFLEKGGTPMKWDKEVILALIGFAGTVVLAAKEIILAEIDKEKALSSCQ